MSIATETWTALEARMRDLATLGRVGTLLGWDQETYMALRGSEARGRQLAIMGVLRHERLTDPTLGELIDRAGDEQLSEPRAAMLRKLRRDRGRALRLPPEFVRRAAMVRARGVNAWHLARQEGDFGLYREALEDVVALKRDEADLLGHDGERYDALLDIYEPGLRVARIEQLLAALR